MKKLSLLLPAVWAMFSLLACENENKENNKDPEKGESFTEALIPGLDLKMVYVEGGSFQMGATAEQVGDADSDEFPVHKVTLSPYYIGKYEVTQSQWEAVMGTTLEDLADGRKIRGKGDDYPIYYVPWDKAEEFCEVLSAKTGKKYMLPTEAQWEYAARGGKKSKGFKYSGSDTLDKVAWYGGNNGGDRVHVVGVKIANELGVYDMSGNVREWCSDWYGSYDERDVENPIGPEVGYYHVDRGGGWDDLDEDMRVSYRGYYGPDYDYYYRGFRVVLVP